MFWGVTLETGKRYAQVVSDSFHVSMAALEPQAGATAGIKPFVSVMVEREKSEFLLCTLQQENMLQQPLDLNFDEGESLTFFLNGEGVVHLTGFLADNEPYETFNEDEDDENDDDSEEDDLSDEEVIANEVKSDKRKAIEGKLPVAKKKKLSLDRPAIEESSDEDDDDDDDSDEEDTDDDSDIVIDEDSSYSELLMKKFDEKNSKPNQKGAQVAQSGAKGKTPMKKKKKSLDAKTPKNKENRKSLNKDKQSEGKVKPQTPFKDQQSEGKVKPQTPFKDQQSEGKVKPQTPFKDQQSEGKVKPQTPFKDQQSKEKGKAQTPFKNQQPEGKGKPQTPFRDQQPEGKGKPQTPFRDQQSEGKEKPQTPFKDQQPKENVMPTTPSPNQPMVNGGKSVDGKKKKKPRRKRQSGSEETLSPSVQNTPTTPVSNKDQQSPKKDQKLPGGIIIEDLHVGNGPVAKPGKMLHMYYVGKLSNNTEFDKCAKDENPFKFRLGQKEVINGWDIGIKGMKVGGRRKIIVPPHQGYGTSRTGKIPPNSTLHFEVELVAVS